jgi:threonyl-tRNA synthetase
MQDKDGKTIWNDLCRGPHLPSTNHIKAFKLLKFSGSYWRGDEKKDHLQRIYATAFWSKKDLDDYLQRLEEAEKRDHRRLSKQLDLFSVHEEVGPGLVFWHPNLATVRAVIEDYWRDEHRKRTSLPRSSITLAVTSSLTARTCIRLWTLTDCPTGPSR